MLIFITAAVLVLVVGGVAFAARRTMHPPIPRPAAGKITVAAIGDSNTYGAGVLLKGRNRWAYPAQLAQMLGDRYQVLNYGLNRRALQRDGDWPYAASRFAEASLRARADIVLIMLGTNDARGDNWNATAYESELADFAARYSADRRSTVYFLTPPVAFPNRRGVSERVVAEEVAPIVRRIAAQHGLPLIDIFRYHRTGHHGSPRRRPPRRRREPTRRGNDRGGHPSRTGRRERRTRRASRTVPGFRVMRMPAWLFTLLAAAFVLYTDDYVIAGILPELAADLDVTEGQAGQLVTVFSLTVALAAPVAAVVLAGVPRRRLFTTALLVFIVANIASAATESFAVMTMLRVAAALAAASMTPALFAFAARHAPAHSVGRYIAVVSLGVTGSIAAGVPLGTWIGGVLGWRATFVTMATAGALVLVLVLATLPRSEGTADAPRLSEQLRSLRRAPISLGLLANCLLMTGSMMMLTYLAPYLAVTTTSGIEERALAFSLSGIAAIAGIGSAESPPTASAQTEPCWSASERSSPRWSCSGRSGRPSRLHCRWC